MQGLKPEDSGPASGLLAGVRVLDLSRVMSGPYCTSMLADLGAEVIKVEMPGSGDESRSIGPFVEGESAYFMLLNRNKKSVTINLKTEAGKNLIKSIIPECDVLVENFRPGVMDRLGLGPGIVRKIHPQIIYASISGFGQISPLSRMPAFDLVIQAMSGLMSLTGPRGGPKTAVGESIADVCTGMFAAFGIVAALFDRARSGRGRHLDVAMLDSLVSVQLTGLSRQLYDDDTPVPVGNRHPVTYPVDSFETRSGAIVLVCFSDRVFEKLGKAIGNPDLPSDVRFRTVSDRNENEQALRQIIANWASSQSQDGAVNCLLDHGIPAAPILDLRQVLETEHAEARQLVIDGEHAKLGSVPLVPQPVRVSESGRQKTSTPTLGEHTQEVLRALAGTGEDELQMLRKDRVT